jgi:NAD(P)-dependent dehydrogenase (short-subunit alcohol dehydrogenase family)
MRDGGGGVVVVTGASAGVGRATVRAFAKERSGARVALLARGAERLEEAAQEVERAGGRALALPTDVGDPAAVERAAATVERELGSIDVWVNCAMTSVFSRAVDMHPEEFRRVMEVNYLGYVHGTLAALRRMRPRDHGTVVQVSSAVAFRGLPLQSAYSASKSAIVGFTEAVRSELLHDGSRVHLTMVHMPALNTPQFDWSRSRMPCRAQPVPPIFQPEVAARAIVWSARHRRRSLEVGLSSIEAILGNKIVPGLLDRYLARKGFRAQQTKEPADPNQPDNLFQPVPGDFGAHGRFDDRAHAHSPALWLAMHSRALLLTAAAAGVIGLGVARARTRLWR